MWCNACTVVTSRVLLCSFVAGALRRSHDQKVKRLPNLRGGPHAVAAPATWTDLLGARAERVPDCSSYLSRIPRSATDSGLSVHPRDSVDRAAAGSFHPPHARLHALLNASAASESTTAGGLEAFPLSKLRWSREEPVSKPVTGLKMRALNSAGIRARAPPLYLN